MKRSNKSKPKVDEISRETQRLVKDRHVHLPYHIPKQKSLKDFLNRPKIPTENQVPLTGPKKLLQKAWELIENKEQNVEKFYNEISIQNEASEESKSPSNDDIIQPLQTEKNNSVDLDNEKELLLLEFDDEENCENSELSDSDKKCSLNDDENSKDATSVCSGESLVLSIGHLRQGQLFKNYLVPNPDNSNSQKSDYVIDQALEDNADSDEQDCFSEDEENISCFTDNTSESEDEEIEISTNKKKRKPVLLSDSSDDEVLLSESSGVDEHDSITKIETSSNDLIPLSDEQENNTISITKLMEDEESSDTETKIMYNDIVPLLNESDNNMSTQQLMELCSGQFQTQPETQENELEDTFDSSVPLDNADEDDDINKDVVSDNEMPKLTSINDFFDNEAELSESDWSSDDENHEADKLDKLDEEAGDKDVFDEKLIKDGLDKIYMRQLLDDDIKQVTELKERLLEDGELYSDTGRKRKFQWDETDQNDVSFKRPLFSDSEDEENELLNGDDDLSGLWRKERFKRESYLSQNDSEDEILPDDCEESSDNLQKSILSVKKTHLVKYKNDEILLSKDNSIAVEINNSTISDSPPEKKNKDTNDLILPCVPTISKAMCNNLHSSKLLKGSFMKRNNVSKITTLLNMNKNNDQIDNENRINKNDIKALTTITAKACNNPFTYMLTGDKKQDNKNVTATDIKSMNTEKKDFVFNSQSFTSVQSPEETKNKKKITNSILMHLE